VQTVIGTLNDTDIEASCQIGVLIEENYDPKRVKQACYELRCGTIFYRQSEKYKRFVVEEGGNIVIKPGDTLVIITYESLKLPADIIGRIFTKGVLFSLGIVPVKTYADPGFSGRLGIVMSNISGNYIKLSPGEPIAKIEFSRLQYPVTKPYDGQHGYQTEIWPLRLDLLMTEEEIRTDPRTSTDD